MLINIYHEYYYSLSHSVYKNHKIIIDMMLKTIKKSSMDSHIYYLLFLKLL